MIRDFLTFVTLAPGIHYFNLSGFEEFKWVFKKKVTKVSLAGQFDPDLENNGINEKTAIFLLNCVTLEHRAHTQKLSRFDDFMWV